MRLGWIGLGDMGNVIIPRLIAAGHEVTGWNRTPGKADDLIAHGMVLADTPRDVAAGSEVVFSMVTDAKAVAAVALGDDGVISGLSPDAYYLDMSTVGGDRAAFDKVEELLHDVGSKVSYIGPSGTAVQMKVAINLTLIVEMVVFCESVALAEKGGVDRAVAVDAMLKSVVASPVMGYRGPFILDMPDKPLADVTLQQKDMVLALEVARRQGSAAPLGAVANELLNACRGLGIDHRDFVTVFDVYHMLSGGGSR